MNKLMMAGVVIVVAGTIFIGSYAAAYGVLLATPGQNGTTTVSTGSSSTHSSTTSTSPPSSTTSASSTQTTSTTPPPSSTTTTTRTTTTTTSTTRTTTTTTTSTTTSTSHTSSTGGAFKVTLVINQGGWNGSTKLVVNIPKGSAVTLNILYQDPSGDQHPLFMNGYNIVGPTMSPSDKQDSISFTANTAGTFTILCLNPDCTYHNLIDGTISIVIS